MKTEFSASDLADKRVVSGATDDVMVYGLLVWASSLQATRTAPFHLVVAYFRGTLSETNQNLISNVLGELGINHSFLPLDLDERFVAQGHISPTTFTKFLIADRIPSAHLWIDVDTVAMPGWDDLFTEIEQAPQQHDLVVASRGARAPTTNPLAPLAPSDLPFNAGVLGWPASPRKDWVSKLDEVGDVPTIEQFIFNTLYDTSAFRVPENFNMLTYRIDRIDEGNKPRIVHYAGAHKPWHLTRRLGVACTRYRCPWSLWFEAEKAMLAHLSHTACLKPVLLEQRRALRSGKMHWRRDHSGFLLLRVLRVLGPLGWVILLAATPFRRWIPRGTHPLH